MKNRLARTFIGIFLLGIFLGTCSPVENQLAPTSVVQIVQEQITTTPRLTATHTFTPAPTITPTPTPTPTPTALPIEITGDPFAGLAVEPVSQAGAQCGFVDYFDFPINPPDAELGRGGGDFGIYRSRYQSNHAGEDWGLQTRDNLGEPVYVVGHGMVMYSQPYGWGLDQGTVIVRHIFRDGRVVYSFYGHLDPPSVTLRPGTCLERGDTVANIGDPSGRPHLHFEIRLHNPDTPGPGYWPVDPTLAGWLPPSQTIWETRMERQPGTVWTHFPTEGISQYVGATEDMFFIIEAGELRAITIADGRVIWRQGLETNFPRVLLAAEAGLVYLSDPLGHLEAFSLPTPEMMAEWNNTKVILNHAWELELDVTGSPTLMPLPGGGVIVSVKQRTMAFSPEGEELWKEEGLPMLVDWQFDEEQVIISTIGNSPTLWTATEAGIEPFAEEISGQLAVMDDQVFVYDREGVYRVGKAGEVERVYVFGRGIGTGQVVSLPGSGVLIVHTDLNDTRMLMFDVSGGLVWERSLKGIEGDPVRVLEINGEVFLLAEESQASAAIIHLYRVDLSEQTLTNIFKGGTRTAIQGGTWGVSLNDDGMLLQIGGGHVVLYLPQENTP